MRRIAPAKGVLVEFDFTALNGADLLFETTRDYLSRLDKIPYDRAAEARYMDGGNYQGALAELFAAVKTKKTAQKAARELAAAFVQALNVAIPKAFTPSLRNFTRALADRGVKVVFATRADFPAVAEAFAPLLGDRVRLYHETSLTYGSVKWDAWRRVCVAEELRTPCTLAVTGSGYGVKSALRAGLGVIAVANPHVAYQDFTGADAVVRELSGTSAKTVLEALRIG